MTDATADLIADLGPDRVRLGDDIPARNRQDAARLPPVRPAALILPRDTGDLAAALRFCDRFGQPVAVQGGMTGAVGGAHPGPEEVAISTERLVGIEEVDPVAQTMTVRAGTPLQLVQEAAAGHGLMFGVDLGARGSATIGGLAATNAGGNQVLRWGMMRANLLGLEAVLADGTVVTSLRKLMKNNTGLDWTQLMTGTEGTLGVVTRALLRLRPAPARVDTALVAFADTRQALAALERAQRELPGGPLTFELMWREFYGIAGGIEGIRTPLPAGHEVYGLIEMSAMRADGDTETLGAMLGDLLGEGVIADAVLAKSEAERQSLWAIRESSYRYGEIFPPAVAFDISVPVSRLAKAVAELRAGLDSLGTDVTHVVFGHAGDGNVHVMAMPPELSDGFLSRIAETVYAVAVRFSGSVSAEHGIGRTKRKVLPMSRAAGEIELMRRVKAALDPNGILNPGRIL